MINNNLLKMYREHASSDEAFAVLFVKQNISQSKGYWVDITDCRRYEISDDNLHFRFVLGALYERKIKPEYPPKSDFHNRGKFDERRYYLAVRAITWATANEDIRQQKLQKIAGRKFKITGVSYDKNKNNTEYFRDDAPPEIKALAKNISNKTNPLWDSAMAYINEPEFVYKIKSIQVDNTPK